MSGTTSPFNLIRKGVPKRHDPVQLRCFVRFSQRTFFRRTFKEATFVIWLLYCVIQILFVWTCIQGGAKVRTFQMKTHMNVSPFDFALNLIIFMPAFSSIFTSTYINKHSLTLSIQNDCLRRRERFIRWLVIVPSLTFISVCEVPV